jgi:hypothetical protein
VERRKRASAKSLWVELTARDVGVQVYSGGGWAYKPRFWIWASSRIRVRLRWEFEFGPN